MLELLINYNILYVEDEPEIQANIAEYLSNYFANVLLASKGEEALAQYKAHRPDVILLDINLPDIDGLSIAKQIRESDQNIKIIMLTAYTEKEKLLKATELKLTKYLVKPVAPKLFKETLKALSRELSRNPSHYINLGENYLWSKQENLLRKDDSPIKLSEKEHRLMKLFMQYKSSVVSYEKIIAMVWDDAFDRGVSIDSVKNQVSQLRKKLPPRSISSVYGEGYIFN